MTRKYSYVTELLRAADAIESPDERAELIRFNMRPSVQIILAAFHNPDIKFYRPSNITYKVNNTKLGISDTRLDIEAKRLYIFEKDNNIEVERKRVRLIQILETIAKEESDFLYNHILTKKNPFKNLNKNFVKKYFPEVITMRINR